MACTASAHGGPWPVPTCGFAPIGSPVAHSSFLPESARRYLPYALNWRPGGSWLGWERFFCRSRWRSPRASRTFEPSVQGMTKMNEPPLMIDGARVVEYAVFD